MNAIVRPPTPYDVAITAKRALRDARENCGPSGGGYSRAQIASLLLVQRLRKSTTIAARFLQRAVTGAHAAARGGR